MNNFKENQVTIKEKRLLCGFHNGWNFINSGGFQSKIILKDARKANKSD
jgi:hypothetical protein